MVFDKFPTALLPHEGTVRLPRLSTQVDYEAELVLVIGRGGRHIPGARPAATRRLYLRQRRLGPRLAEEQAGRAMAFGKSFDTFAPCGPWMVTGDEIPEPGHLGVQLRSTGK